MDGSPGTGTVRSALKPPPVSIARERRSDASHSPNLTRKLLDRENQSTPVSGNVFNESTANFHQEDAQSEDDDKRLDKSSEDDSFLLSGSGTVVVRSPKQTPYTAFSNQSTKPASRSTSSEDVSISGTVVLRTQHEDSDTPRTSKSRLGLQEKSSIAVHEDSANNLAEAKAALQAGFRRGNARERPALGRHNKDAHETKATSNTESSRDSAGNFDVQKVPNKSRQTSDGEGGTRASASVTSPALSALIIPSLKEVGGDKSEGQGAPTVIESLIDLEQRNPGSCEAFVGRLLQRLGSSKESTMKGLQDLAARSFAKKSETPPDLPDNRRQAMAHPLETSTSLSPLARFLLTRWQSQVSQDLNSV